jgi:hypothetical protein
MCMIGNSLVWEIVTIPNGYLKSETYLLTEFHVPNPDKDLLVSLKVSKYIGDSYVFTTKLSSSSLFTTMSPAANQVAFIFYINTFQNHFQNISKHQ